MPSTLSLLPSLTVASLRKIAHLTGLPTGGNKSVLIDTLVTQLPQPLLRCSPAAEVEAEADVAAAAAAAAEMAMARGSDAVKASAAARRRGRRRRDEQLSVVSIDLGLKNLAYVHFTLESTQLSPPFPAPVVHAWAHLPPPSAPLDFSPRTLAAHARAVVTRLLLQACPAPTHLLVESQRWRTSSSPAIQQWTIRVNTLEACLWGCLCGMQWAGRVEPVEPRRVSVWLDEVYGRDDVGKRGYSEGKKWKVGIVADLIQSEAIKFAKEARHVKQAFLEKAPGRRARRRSRSRKTDAADSNTNTDSDIGKLDDLADCLVQAVAMLKWEECRRSIVHGDDGIAQLANLGIDVDTKKLKRLAE